MPMIRPGDSLYPIVRGIKGDERRRGADGLDFALVAVNVAHLSVLQQLQLAEEGISIRRHYRTGAQPGDALCGYLAHLGWKWQVCKLQCRIREWAKRGPAPLI